MANNSPTSGVLGTVIVTGAPAGIGRAYAERLAARGFDLILVARRVDRLEALAESLRDRFGVAARAIKTDLGHSDDLEALAHLIGHDQTITMLVNNAGTSTLAPISTRPETCVHNT